MPRSKRVEYHGTRVCYSFLSFLLLSFFFRLGPLGFSVFPMNSRQWVSGGDGTWCSPVARRGVGTKQVSSSSRYSATQHSKYRPRRKDTYRVRLAATHFSRWNPSRWWPLRGMAATSVTAADGCYLGSRCPALDDLMILPASVSTFPFPSLFPVGWESRAGHPRVTLRWLPA